MYQDSLMIVAATARFQSLCRGRISRKAKIKGASMLKLVNECGKAEVSAVDVIERTFYEMSSESCLRIFGIPYPPIEYTYSNFNLRRIVPILNGTAEKVSGRLEELYSKVSADEYFSRRVSKAGLAASVMSSEFSSEWLEFVIATREHLLHNQIKRLCREFEVTPRGYITSEEIKYLVDVLMEGENDGEEKDKYSGGNI